MIPYIGYRQAKQSLELTKETIAIMGDDNYMLLAQRDMLELEVDHFRKESRKFTIKLLTVCVIGVILGLSYYYGVF
jgi:hypothetical protein